jgi:hypothetical protein
MNQIKSDLNNLKKNIEFNSHSINYKRTIKIKKIRPH